MLYSLYNNNKSIKTESNHTEGEICAVYNLSFFSAIYSIEFHYTRTSSVNIDMGLEPYPPSFFENFQNPEPGL